MSYTKDLNHGFLASRWFVYNWFMDLCNQFETIVHYLLIGGVTGIGHWANFHMVSTLVCMFTHWKEHVVNNNIEY